MGGVSARDRFRGCLVGLAAGDALGTTLEFSPLGSFDPIDDMVGGGLFGLRAGQWTDDTSMALCLAISLLESDEQCLVGVCHEATATPALHRRGG